MRASPDYAIANLAFRSPVQAIAELARCSREGGAGAAPARSGRARCGGRWCALARSGTRSARTAGAQSRAARPRSRRPARRPAAGRPARASAPPPAPRRPPGMQRKVSSKTPLARESTGATYGHLGGVATSAHAHQHAQLLALHAQHAYDGAPSPRPQRGYQTESGSASLVAALSQYAGKQTSWRGGPCGTGPAHDGHAAALRERGLRRVHRVADDGHPAPAGRPRRVGEPAPQTDMLMQLRHWQNASPLWWCYVARTPRPRRLPST